MLALIKHVVHKKFRLRDAFTLDIYTPTQLTEALHVSPSAVHNIKKVVVTSSFYHVENFSKVSCMHVRFHQYCRVILVMLSLVKSVDALLTSYTCNLV